MSRILDTEGRYAPVVPEVSTPEPIDPEGLPQTQPDRYANVDPTDFTGVDNLSRGQMMTLSEIASSRNQPQVAMRWKQLATERIRHDRQQESIEHAERLAQNTFTPPHGSRVVDVDRSTPWDNDDTYRELAHEHGDISKQLDAMEMVDDDFFELSGRMAVVADKMATRKEQLVDNLQATGAWTQADDRRLEAQQSLVEKSAQMQELMKGSGIE